MSFAPAVSASRCPALGSFAVCMHVHHIRYKIASIVVILLIRILVLMFSMPIERKYERVSILFAGCFILYDIVRVK